MQEEKILDQLTVVLVETSCVSGAVSKSGIDKNGNDVFTDGSVRYMDRKLLRPFTRARQASARICRTHGTRFLGGWAIPDESLNEVKASLEEISNDFDRDKADLNAQLGAHRLEWEAKHPEIGEYRGRFPTDMEVSNGLQYYVSVYKIQPGDMAGLKNGVAAAVNGFAGQVLSEISQEVRDTFSADAQKATSRATNVLVRIKTKLERLAFVDQELANVAKMIEDVLKELPASGPIRGHDFVMFSGLMNTLSEPSMVVNTARMLAQDTEQDVWSTFGASTESTLDTPSADATANDTGAEPDSAQGGMNHASEPAQSWHEEFGDDTPSSSMPPQTQPTSSAPPAIWNW